MRVVFMGTPEFAVPTLLAVAKEHTIVHVISQPDAPAGRGARLTPPPVALAARDHGWPLMQPTKVKTPEFAEAMRALAADVAVVVAYGRILPTAVLTAFRLGCINVHASLLPAYRGAAPVQRAVWDGVATTGVSIMQLDEGMDTGPVFQRVPIEVGPTETFGQLLARLAEAGATALAQTLRDLEAGVARALPQDSVAVSHAPMLAKADGYIDFAADAAVVSARMRAVDPWPGATVRLRKAPVKLFGTSVAAAAGEHGAPGTVLEINTRGEMAGAVVACRQGTVRICEVQPAGKNRMTVGALAHGRGLVVGDVFERFS